MPLFIPSSQNTTVQSDAAAKIYKPPGGAAGVDVVNDYYWTLTPPEGRKEIPRIDLIEYQVNESTISRQFQFYTQQALNSVPGRSVNYLSPYEELFPKNAPTGFWYFFPYFSDVNFEVTSPEWASLDTLESVKKAGVDFASFLGGEAAGKFAEKGIDFLTSSAGAAMSLVYPKVGIMDRPKLWQTHNFRSYTIKFPLYNTFDGFNPTANEPEWYRNRKLCELLINQNLYNKTSFITGIPPVFYEVLIPGQHYSPATCVTNITVYNRGNIRQFTNPAAGTGNVAYNVPDVYEVNINLQDMVIPSKNLFQAISDPVVRSTLNKQSGQPQPGSCWVAREVYGINNIKWILFRNWLYGKTGPKWLQKNYSKHGLSFAKWISKKPIIKTIVRKLMDLIIKKHYESK